MNIILIGMRGSGKTTVGKLLAKKLNINFIETDELVVTDFGISISEIVDKFGWSKFRESESKIMIDLALTRTNDVIATGGGVVENEQNMDKLKNNNNIIIWLKCSIDTIINRIGNDNSRPLITNGGNFTDDLRKVYKVRESLYEKYADITVSSEDKPELIVAEIVSILKVKGIL